MSNLRVSCYKFLMLLFVALSIFYSCTADEDLLLEAVNQNNTKEPNSIESGFEETTTSDSESPDETDASVEKEGNLAPIAIATPSNGAAPLEVTFTVGDALAGKTFAKYEWKFKDGTKSSSSKTTHTFKEVGKHDVELIATDDAGQVVTDTVIVTVTEPINEAPKAVAIANTVSGEAPLQVDFSGNDSSDDKGIVDYNWNFQDNETSNQSVDSHNFNDPGTYNVTLTVTDEEGLQDTTTLVITVNQEQVTANNIDCGIGGGYANDTGEKIWCWDSVVIPDYSGSKGQSFSGGELAIDSECNEKQVTKVGDRINFRVNPITPDAGTWCSNSYNMRAEVSTRPWSVNHPKGTEEWFGWSQRLGNDYVIDKVNPWLFFQVHHAVRGDSPHFELMMSSEGLYNTKGAGEILVSNNAISEHVPTGFIPKAGETLDIVVHAIWGDESNGLLQVWINGQQVYNKQVRTVYSHHEYGGNAKWGIYKWGWRNESAVQSSLDQGVTHVETSIGAVRMITRRPGDSEYGKDSYALVSPN